MKMLLATVLFLAFVPFGNAQNLCIRYNSASIKTIDFNKLNGTFLPGGLHIGFYPGNDYAIIHNQEKGNSNTEQVSKANESYLPYKASTPDKPASNTDDHIAIVASPYLFYVYYGDMDNIR